jgi:hypothetical protein
MEREVAISGGQIHAQFRDANDKSFAVSAELADECENDAMKREEQSWDNEGGHMSSKRRQRHASFRR